MPTPCWVRRPQKFNPSFILPHRLKPPPLQCWDYLISYLIAVAPAGIGLTTLQLYFEVRPREGLSLSVNLILLPYQLLQVCTASAAGVDPLLSPHLLPMHFQLLATFTFPPRGPLLPCNSLPLPCITGRLRFSSSSPNPTLPLAARAPTRLRHPFLTPCRTTERVPPKSLRDPGPPSLHRIRGLSSKTRNPSLNGQGGSQFEL